MENEILKPLKPLKNGLKTLMMKRGYIIFMLKIN